MPYNCRWTKLGADFTLGTMQPNRTLRALASRIKELRDQKGISQEELAHRAGLSRTGMGFLETGKRWPRLDTLMKVADGLNITLDELLKGLHKPSRRR
jgi:transcriptional regulator with XRE-family HTH domain